ncbi:zf-DHHC-domain-containing protein [Massarina eburnea CBS 473.64]|uniref:Palmitoyltransferase n=1 Tax=Massarina eburnea CBS 473.64 TaxID=1395130 RepID=A0A6A6RME3_9PLEO|nr:zf-DHHC-domain-containing protein [Massarina eburnea CBS 473.64]
MPRRSTAIGLITVYCLLLICLFLSWMRLLHVIWTNPGLIPLGDPNIEKQDTSVRYFDKYSAYISDYEGRPQFCDKCHNYKPDRSHHCRELNRCVRRMDHYCPWAGGIISETTHKFFIQFVFYGALWTLFLLIPTSYYLAERMRIVGDKPSTWIACVALSAIFVVFTGTMFFMTTWNVSINYSTVETVQRGGINNITMLTTRSHRDRRSSRASTTRASTTREKPNVLREVVRDGREYVVFQTQPFDHPWDLGNKANLQSVMGERVIDWFIPLKMSPCVRHEDSMGEFAWSDAVLDMARDWEKDNPGRRIRLVSEWRERSGRSGR